LTDAPEKKKEIVQAYFRKKYPDAMLQALGR